MMGSRMQTTAMFQYFCLDDWVPADHLLRSIDRHIDFRALRTQLRPLYSDVGRPSIDPEVLLRILLIGYLYGITSERRLMDEVGTKPRISLVHGPRLRSVDSRSLDVLKEPARSLP
jgi:transposase